MYKIASLLCCIFVAFADIEKDIKDNIQNTLQDQLPGLNNTVEEAQELFKKKCKEQANDAAYDNVMKSKDTLIDCLTGLVDIEKIKEEIEEAKPTGDLDVVFKKYCKKTPLFKKCVSNFTSTVEVCLNEKERTSTNIILNITESLANFICYKEGDRIALFIAEGGPECLTDKMDGIQECANSTLSKYVPKEELSLANLPEFVIHAEQCDDMQKLHKCIVKELESCSEPTPSNIADSLFKFIRQVTPCGDESGKTRAAPQKGSKSEPSSASSFTAMTSLLALSTLYFL